MSDDPSYPAGAKPPPYVPTHPAPSSPLTAPPGGFGVNLPPGVSASIYEQQEQSAGSGHGLALASLVLGILSMVLGLCCGAFTIVLGLGGIACGVIALNQRPSSSDRTLAWIGIGTSSVALVLFVGLLIFGFGLMLISP